MGCTPYSDALSAGGLEHARVIAEKRISGAPRTVEDWLDNNAEVNLALFAKAGRLAREYLDEAHLDAVYAATKGYKRLFEGARPGAEYHPPCAWWKDSIDKVQFVGRPRAEQLGFDEQETVGVACASAMRRKPRFAVSMRRGNILRLSRRIESLKIHCRRTQADRGRAAWKPSRSVRQRVG